MVLHADIAQKFKMAAVNPEIHASTFVHGISFFTDSYEIPTATPLFSGSSFTMGPVLVMCSVSGCEKFTMAAVNRK